MSTVIQFPGGDSLSNVVAANIRAEAARRGYSQSRLAAAIGVARTTVSDRFREDKPWQLDEIEKVASVLGVTLATLVARSEGFEPPTF